MPVSERGGCEPQRICIMGRPHQGTLGSPGPSCFLQPGSVPPKGSLSPPQPALKAESRDMQPALVWVSGQRAALSSRASGGASVREPARPFLQEPLPGSSCLPVTVCAVTAVPEADLGVRSWRKLCEVPCPCGHCSCLSLLPTWPSAIPLEPSLWVDTGSLVIRVSARSGGRLLTTSW